MSLKDQMFKAVTDLHRSLLVASKGKIGGQLVGMPVVMLTTTGRRSGKTRQSMLTTPLELGDSLVLVASFGGDDRHPTWYLNLRDNPHVEVTIGGRTRPMVARIAEGTERADLWKRLTAAHANYAGYQKKTDRQIPVVILDPAR